MVVYMMMDGAITLCLHTVIEYMCLARGSRTEAIANLFCAGKIGYYAIFLQRCSNGSNPV